MKTKPAAQATSTVSDLRRHYPDLAQADRAAMRRLADRVDPSYKN